MEAIWKDMYLTPSGYSDRFHFYIEFNDIIRAEGSVDRLPDGILVIPANVLCGPYLYTEFPTETGVTFHSGACGEFYFVDYDTGTEVTSSDFINDWSYEDRTFNYNLLSNPINGHADPRQYFFATTYNQQGHNITIE